MFTIVVICHHYKIMTTLVIVNVRIQQNCREYHCQLPGACPSNFNGTAGTVPETPRPPMRASGLDIESNSIGFRALGFRDLEW